MTMGRPRTVSDEQVLAGAARAIARVGPARLTLAEVGREVGLSAATLVQRFGSKRGVLLAVARHGAKALPLQMSAAQDASAPATALIDVLTGIAGTINSSAEFANHLAFLLLDLSDPQFQQISHDYTAAVEAAIADVLTASQAAGELAPGDLSQLPRAIHAAYNGALLTWGMAGEGSPAEHVRSQLILLLGPYFEPVRSAQPRPS
ncbi:MAG: TetR/AcrR family transcriptional regulator [Catenulisporales bacterium]|nr:TetR/AcrR family transcriptional regulator [Catenulisporales bacterium]